VMCVPWWLRGLHSTLAFGTLGTSEHTPLQLSYDEYRQPVWLGGTDTSWVSAYFSSKKLGKFFP